jgi:hypothetical protein
MIHTGFELSQCSFELHLIEGLSTKLPFQSPEKLNLGAG